MSSSVNRVVLVGRLVADPELRHTQGGTAVCQFALAVNSREKVGEEWVDRADFIEIVVWGNQAESAAQHLGKGRLVGVDGRLRQDRWEKDGQKRSMVKVTAQNVQYLDRAEGEGDGDTGAPDDALPFDPRSGTSTGGSDDDIPF